MAQCCFLCQNPTTPQTVVSFMNRVCLVFTLSHLSFSLPQWQNHFHMYSCIIQLPTALFLAFLKNRYSFSFSLLLSLPHHLIWASDWLLLLQLWIGKCQVYRLLPSLQCKHIVLQSCIISPAVGLYLWCKPMEISSIWLEKCTPRIKMQHCMHALKLPHKPGLSPKVYWSVKLWPGKEISLSVPQ